MFTTLGALALLGCSDTASAQPQLTVSPATTPNSPLVFNNIPAGEISQSQAGHGRHGERNHGLRHHPGKPDLPLASGHPQREREHPGTFSVAADTTTLTAGAYNGSFTVSVSGALGAG